ncbi:hypothetical protein Tco_0097704 [Tanacetum coccineum]
MLGRSTTEAMHLFRSLMEKYRKRQRDLHMAFLDLEKAYDRGSRELILKTLIDKGTPYVRGGEDPCMDHNYGSRTSLRIAISPYLSALILDELSRGIQESIPWCMCRRVGQQT